MVTASDRAPPRATRPVSIVTVVAHQQQKQHPFELPAAWYRKTLPTFADALALQTTALANADFQMSSADVDTVKVSCPLQHLV